MHDPEAAPEGAAPRGAAPPRSSTSAHLPSARWAVALALAGVLASCRAYEPAPLDRAAERAAWHARTLDAASLRAFLERVDRTNATELATFDPADGLTVREGTLVALAYNGALRLARLRVAGTVDEAEQVAPWRDPALSLDALRITEDVPDRWVVSAGLQLSLPLSDRVDAERDLASAEVAAARGTLLEAEWDVWHDTSRAWLEWSAEVFACEETAHLLESVEGLLPVSAALAERGELPTEEAALFEIEAVELRHVQLERGARRAAAEQRLRGLLGVPPEADVTLVPTLVPPCSEVEVTDGAADRIEAGNPTLTRLRREHEVAEQSLRTEIERALPDLLLGPFFESDAGQRRLGLTSGLPLPIFDGNRRGIARARAARTLAGAVVAAQYEQLVAEHAATVARLLGLEERRRGLEDELVPLLDRQLERVLALRSIGEGSSLVLLETLTRAHRAKLDLIATRAELAIERVHAAHLLGPEPNTSRAEPAGEEPR